MSVSTSRRSEARPLVAAGCGEDRVLLTGVDRDLYEAIDRARGETSIPRLTWLGEELELMSPSYLHESLAHRLARLVVLVAEALGTDVIEAGSTTWRGPGPGPGKEPDACFYLANAPTVRGLSKIEPGVDPPPDLVIEVEISRPLIDAGAIYATLGVPELWRCDGQALRIFHLAPDVGYAEQEQSRALPHLRPAEAMSWVVRAEEIGSRAWKAEVERWVREDLARRPG